MLSIIEGRIIGSLIEKQVTTPDQYPLTLNALLSAANQSSSREPVMRLETHEVDAALLGLKGQSLIRFVHPAQGRSVTRYRQVADESWRLAEAERAVVCVLLLRGPQTSGELRSRTERLHEFSSLAEVEEVLDALSRREEPMVQRLEREPGRKEPRWLQLLAESPIESPAAVRSGTAVRDDRIEELGRRVSQLEGRLDALLSSLEGLIDLTDQDD